MPVCEVSLGLRPRWFVRPLLRAALIVALLGLPVPVDPLARFLAAYGFQAMIGPAARVSPEAAGG